jgi:hypothetical protein
MSPHGIITLKKIDEPAPKTRSILFLDSQTTTLVLKGDSAAARDRACGKCGTILISQMEAKQFLTAGKSVQSLG